MLEELRRNLFIALELTWANMKSRYRKTIAGFLWVVLNPLITFGVQFFVFKTVLKIAVPNYLMFLAGGLLPWIFITQTLAMCTSSFVNAGYFLRSFTVSPYSIFLAQVLDNFINFLAAFILIVLPLSIYYSVNLTGLAFLPVAVIVMLFGTIGLSFFLAVLHVFFRDTAFIVQFVTGVVFFLTPIFYPVEYIPQEYRWFVDFNTFYAFIEPFSICVSRYDFTAFLLSLKRAFIHLAVIWAMAIFLWRKKKNEFYLYI